MLRLKTIKDKLLAAGEKITDNDLVFAALTGLLAEFYMIRTVILARDTPISLKEFRAQLLGAEKSLEDRMQSLVDSMSAMYVNGPLPTFSIGASNFQHVSNASGVSNDFVAHEASNSASSLTGSQSFQ